MEEEEQEKEEKLSIKKMNILPAINNANSLKDQALVWSQGLGVRRAKRVREDGRGEGKSGRWEERSMRRIYLSHKSTIPVAASRMRVLMFSESDERKGRKRDRRGEERRGEDRRGEVGEEGLLYRRNCRLQ